MIIKYPTNEEFDNLFDSIQCEPREDEILVIEAPPAFDEVEGFNK